VGLSSRPVLRVWRRAWEDCRPQQRRCAPMLIELETSGLVRRGNGEAETIDVAGADALRTEASQRRGGFVAAYTLSG
jgi:hypothetical protein